LIVVDDTRCPLPIRSKDAKYIQKIQSAQNRGGRIDLEMKQANLDSSPKRVEKGVSLGMHLKLNQRSRRKLQRVKRIEIFAQVGIAGKEIGRAQKS
jgi:hypothetical protein